ncbi:hypothetical protein BD289DRAFT_84674 [Coniella lustricola]|uniref:Uncharacterized protein n=1 Tax=Coniella lustricola TaxID=2025994 RepID=A0A2T2ZZ32_9PEZI|nr:hypothetical protein BD289DRAFT_84674 [Coniella lustricola]
MGRKRGHAEEVAFRLRWVSRHGLVQMNQQSSLVRKKGVNRNSKPVSKDPKGANPALSTSVWLSLIDGTPAVPKKKPKKQKPSCLGSPELILFPSTWFMQGRPVPSFAEARWTCHPPGRPVQCTTNVLAPSYVAKYACPSAVRVYFTSNMPCWAFRYSKHITGSQTKTPDLRDLLVPRAKTRLYVSVKRSWLPRLAKRTKSSKGRFQETQLTRS